MSKKGVSAAEKRKRMLDVFHEDPIQPYQLKDLERIAPKAKSIVQQAVKDVVMELVYDNLVHQEKIGTSQYFWSFPSEVAQCKRQKLADLEAEHAQLTASDEQVGAELEALKAGKSADAGYDALVSQLSDVKKRREQLESSLKAQQEGASEDLAHMEASIPKLKEAVNRWTDNIAIAKSYFTKKLGWDKAQFDQWMGIRGGSFFEELA